MGGSERGSGAGPVPDVRLLVPALVSWALVALGVGRGPLVPALAATLELAVAGGLWWWIRRRTERGRVAAGVLLVVLLSAALLLVVAGEEAATRRGPVEELAARKATVELVGDVVAEPRPIRAREPGVPRFAVVIRVRQVTSGGTRASVRTPVLLIGDARWADLRWRDGVAVTARLRPSDAGEQVRATATPKGAPQVTRGASWVGSTSHHVREAMRRACSGLPGPTAGLLPAMVVGDRSAVPSDLADDMTATGMSHLTAVSGTNCSILVGSVLWLAGALRIPRRARPWAGAMAIVLFVVVAHPDPSVLRAAVMGSIGLLGLVASRRAAGMPALAGAILVLLAIDPWLARSYGFALSVLATLGLLLFARPWSDALRTAVPRLGIVSEAIVLPVAAQVTCAPIVILLQGHISLVGIPANAVVAPLVAPITVAGTAVAVMAVAAPAVAAPLAWLPAVPAWGVAAVAHYSAGIPLAVPWSNSPTGAVVLAIVILAAVLLGPPLVRRGVRHRPAVLAVGLVLACVVPVSCLRRAADLTLGGPAVVMCDVGQGDAFILTTGPGHGVLVDAGPDEAAVDRCLRRVGVTVVDGLVLTHFDLDHVGGLDGVDRGREVGPVLVSTAAMHDGPGPATRWLQGRDVRPTQVGDRWDLGEIRLLVRSPSGPEADSANAGSLVVDAVLGRDPRTRLRALLLADADAEMGAAVRRDIDRDPSDVDGGREPFDVVKVAHHGSSDNDPELLTEVAAPVALVSVGEGNRYGHPTSRALGSLAAAGSVVYRTDEDGLVAIWKEDGRLTVALPDS